MPEKEKKRQYEQCIREVEHASFTPLVLSATGSMRKAMDMTFKRLAAMIAEKRDQLYNQTISLIRCMINFLLLRSELRCIRGTRSTIANPIKNPPAIDMITDTLTYAYADSFIILSKSSARSCEISAAG